MTRAKQSSAPVDERLLAAAVRKLARAEPRFAPVVAKHGPPPLWPRDPGFLSHHYLSERDRA